MALTCDGGFCKDPKDNATYCLNGGICCAHFGDKYCRCPSAAGVTYDKRCSHKASMGAVETPMVFNAAAVISVLVIVLVVVLLLLIGYIILRSRRRNQDCCNTHNDSFEKLNPPSNDNTKQTSGRQLGYSWRETTCRRHLSRTFSNSLSNVNMNAAECKNADLRQPTSPKRLQAPDTKIDVVDSPACDIVEEKAAPSSDGPRQTTTHVENEQGPLLGHF